MGLAPGLCFSSAAVLGSALGMEGVLGTHSLWGWTFVIAAALQLPALPLLLYLPNSPAHCLAKEGGEGEARQALLFWEGEVGGRLSEARRDAARLVGSGGWRDLFRSGGKRQLALAVSISSLYFPSELLVFISTHMKIPGEN